MNEKNPLKVKLLKHKRNLIQKQLKISCQSVRNSNIDQIINIINDTSITKKMFEATKKLHMKQSMKPIIKDNNGKIIISPKIKTKIVSECFHSKYKHPITNKTFTPPTNNNQTNITEDEVKTEISCLKNGKACGLDNIKAEQIKSAL